MSTVIGETTSIGELVRASLRMRAMFLLSLSTMVIMVAFFLWALHSLIRQAEVDIRSQFQKSATDLIELESFLDDLVEAVRSSDARIYSADRRAIRKVGSGSGLAYYEGWNEIGELHFGIRTAAGPAAAGQIEAVEPLARLVARRYAYARGGRTIPGARGFLIDLAGTTDIVLPCPASASSAAFDSGCGRYLNGIRQRLMVGKDTKSPSGVHLTRIDLPGNLLPEGAVLLHREITVDEAFWARGSSPHRLVAGAYLEISPEHGNTLNAERAVLRSLTKGASEPVGGDAVDWLAGGNSALESSYVFRPDGLYVNVSNERGWRGVYCIPWTEFFSTTSWQMILLFLLIVICFIGSVVLYGRHRSRVVLPAQAAHELIAESEYFGRVLIDISQVAVAGLSLDDGNVVIRNQLADQWLGDTASMQRLLQAYADGMEEGDAGFLDDCEPMVIGRRHLSVRCGRTRYQGRDVVLAAFSDVTETHQVKAAMAAAKQAADDSNAGKTVFLATMSHEIRTPLYGILGTIELLGLTQLTAQQRGYLDTVQTSSAGLLNIISDILDVSKIESRQLSLKEAEFDPVQLTEEVVRTYAANADAKGLHLYSVIDVGIPRQALGDELRIKQVLNNLLSNAIKFSDAGWVRVLLAYEQGSDGEPMLNWKVTDTGVGVSDAHARILFQPFYQVQGVHNTTPGTGLGLYICRSLCQLMQGQIDVESSPGRGSTFSVLLPMVPVAPSEAAAMPSLQGDQAVWVRAPIGESAQSVGGWLKLAGAKVRIVKGFIPASEEGAVLVELFPDRMPPIGWDGPRVSGTPAGPELPQWGISGVQVNAHSMRSILRAVALAQGGRPKTDLDDGRAMDGGGALRVGALNLPLEGRYRPAVGLDRLGLRVLVVEDNVVNRTLLAKQLETLGCAVTTCADGLEALDRWSVENFDVLLTDMNMPNMDGYELVRILRSQGTTIPIIGITASVMQAERELGMAFGLDAWINKPIDLSTLYDSLRRACAGEVDSSTPPAISWPGSIYLNQELLVLFREAMSSDLPKAWDALSNRDSEALISVLHRIRGALAVMKVEEMAIFSEMLELKVSADGLTPALENAARSMLRELETLLGGFI